ncbi:hypothetical protein M9H77_17817 [Catharanthus roseus]|uniref:Uncharacterized protein n=1 Tax=Catharanthus roseus TaxID=4058 RepID=A0ACC0B5P0_CATRO|nr:hypothetical protein M9H77_17817 [Catharanthus roseus]
MAWLLHGGSFAEHLEEFEGQQRASKLFSVFSISNDQSRERIGGLIMSTDGHLPTQSHQEGTSDPTRMHLNETLRSTQESIEGLARQFQNVARDVKELKKGKSNATMEERVGENIGGGYQGRPQVRGGSRGDLGGRGYHRPQEEFPRHEAWHKDNLYEDYGDNPNIGQAYHGGYYGEDSGTNLFKGGVDNVNRNSQTPMGLKLGPITRAQRRKLKILQDNDIVAYMEEVLEGEHPTAYGSPVPNIVGRLLDGRGFEGHTLPRLVEESVEFN